MTRTGRLGTMVCLLEQVSQDIRPARIVEDVCQRNRPTVAS